MKAIETLIAEPRAKEPPQRVWRDWLVVGVLGPAVLVEAIVRDDLVFPVAAALVGIAMVVASLWRRIHPLLVVAGGFAAIIATDIVAHIVVDESVVLLTGGVLVLMHTYSLFRWGSGREVVIGLGVVAIAVLEGLLVRPFEGVANAIVLPLVLLATAEFGWLMRTYYVSATDRRAAIRLNEREQLARELHDTVAHRVSAIAISAQAGSVHAKTSPPGVADSFATIEQEAKRAMAEMRWIVGRFRDDPDYAPPEFASRPRLADIEELAKTSTQATLNVDVALSGDLDDLGPSLEATAFRLAQESVTNAIRHATNATRVSVSVDGERDALRVTVSDDGDASTAPSTSGGYGMIGMSERAALLGGTLTAGPGPGRGWLVEAVLPRDGAR